MFEEVAMKNGLDFSSFHQDICFTFVLIHPKNRIVVKHTNADLILVCARRLYPDHYENLDLEEIQKEYKEKGMNVNIPERHRSPRLQIVCHQYRLVVLRCYRIQPSHNGM